MTEPKTWGVIPVGTRETTAALEAALRARYPAPEWLTLTQIRCAERQLDAVSARMWTRAYILGFEIKAARGDWLREMRAPEKADACVGLVDEFWLVTATGVAKLEEIPEHWGWICQQPNGKLRQVKRAPQLPVTRSVEERTFWCSLLSRAWRSDEDRQVQQQAIAEARRRGREDAELAAANMAQAQLVVSRAQLEEFQQVRDALGHPSRGPAPAWEILKHAETIKAVIAGERALVDLRGLQEQARRVADRLDRAVQGEQTRIVIGRDGGVKEVSA